jgi:carboxyl-terminal processing protease
LFALGWWVGRVRARADVYAQLDLFVEVMERVRRSYVEPTDPQKMVEGAVRGMLRGLDPYSSYLNPKQYKNLESVTEGSFGGIGVVVSIRDNYPLVISPIEGSPAWEAGLVSGDMIVRIAGKPAAGLTIEEVADRLRGDPGTRVSLSLRREGETQEREVTIERRQITAHSVPYAFLATPGIGYVRLADFSEKSGAEVRDAVQRLQHDGARGLILDLRANPGGLLSQAVDVAEEFLPRGTMIVYTHGRNADQDQRYYSSDAHPLLGWPMVVLVDTTTASASEIVAGALQDLDRALILGRTTYGKGSVQSVFPLKNHDSALKLTTALYYTPSGRSIHRVHRDTTQLDDEDDEAPAPVESVRNRPLFRTVSGRKVYGGGGITPDVVVRPDTLPSLAARLEQRALPLRFANRWVNTHRGERVDASTPVPWSEFVGYLAGEKFDASAAGLQRQRPMLERMVRREMARRCCGDSAAARLFLDDDPAFRRALEVLAHARTPRGVYAAAGLPAVPERASH